MAWYWIVAIILGYIVIGAIGAAITRRYETRRYVYGTDDLEVIVAVFWPAILIASIVVGVIWCLLIVPVKFIINKAYYLVDYICDKWNDWIQKIQLRKAKKVLRSKFKNDEEPSSVFDDIDYERRSK